MTYREREWVVLPSDIPDLIMLRPIGGSAREVCGVYKPLSDMMGYTLPYERINPATFPLPDPTTSQDHEAVRMLLDASRLLLRDGAAPFRSLGHLSVRPRPYQFVPLLMALRLDVVRLLIADDVGVGKTIEAGLIARELLDRGDARRVGVLCPPYLCDQWQAELEEKFQIEAAVFRSGTIARLERQCPPDRSIFQEHPNFVASIDTVKGERYRSHLLQHCPDLLIVDEVHGAARPPGGRRARGQQQRHDLLVELAADAARHLVLLTATPHSGVEEAFQSLLELVKPGFAELDLGNLADSESDDLARHFVQRRRPDVKDWMGTDTPFPDRIGEETTYEFTNKYRTFYSDVYEFARGMVQSADGLSGNRARMRFWSALALMRAVSSSPAAAEATLTRRAGDDDAGADLFDDTTEEQLEEQFEPLVYDPTDAEAVVDAPPTAVLDAQRQDETFADSERRKLAGFAKRAAALKGNEDNKLAEVTETVRKCLRDGYNPIIWCRFIPTSEYLAEHLAKALSKEFKKVAIAAVNGTSPPDERRMKIEKLGEADQRVLIATDCLSEGINLQEHFTAAIHYDLPWNPNRLEQREGRVDRFGQLSPTVRTALVYGTDNPVDGAVLDVLLRKAREIYKTLHIHVPVPTDSETVMETVLKSVFAGEYSGTGQLQLFDQSEEAKRAVKAFHYQMDLAAEREKQTRSRFAQRRINPDEVRRELEETDAILGNPDAVREFLRDAGRRIGFGFRELKDGTCEVDVAAMPETVRAALGDCPDPLKLAFDTPVPEDAVYIGRSHRLIEALGEYIIDQAFYPSGQRPAASRCGVIRTDAVARRTTLMQLRLRFLMYERGDDTPTLAEETLVYGYCGSPPNIEALESTEVAMLMEGATPTGNISAEMKAEVLTDAVAAWDGLQPEIETLLTERAERLTESHRRIRSITKSGRIRIEPQKPPDLLGILILLPVPKGVASGESRVKRRRSRVASLGSRVASQRHGKADSKTDGKTHGGEKGAED